jgi:hypothetical protein
VNEDDMSRAREKRNSYRTSVESQKERAHKEDIDIGGRIILK